MSEKEGKKSGGGGFLGLIIFIIIVWLVYDNFIAKHWVIVYNVRGDNSLYTIDSNGEKFKDAPSCLSYATNLNLNSSVFRYQCGYRCQHSDTQPFVSCQKWS